VVVPTRQKHPEITLHRSRDLQEVLIPVRTTSNNVPSVPASWLRSGTAPAQLVRFAATGGITFVVQFGLFYSLFPFGGQVATWGSGVVSSMLANEMHRRLTFRAGSRVPWWTAQWEGGGLSLVALAATSAALALAGDAFGTGWGARVLLIAAVNAAVGLSRFALLRTLVFGGKDLTAMKRLPTCAAVSVIALSATAACAGPDEAATGGSHAHPTVDASTAPLRAGEQFVHLRMSQPYTPSPPNGGSDDYRCVVVDPQVTDPVFLTGVQFQPQDASIAHHAITFVVPPPAASGVRDRDARTPGEGYTCFGMDGGVSTASWVDTWTPGGRETLFDGDMGYRLEPGSLLVLQIHYNLHGAARDAAVSDRSGIRLRQTGGTARTVSLNTVPLSAPIELPCEPDESGPLCDRDAAVEDVARRFGRDAGGRADWLLRMCGYDAPRPGDRQSCDVPAPGGVTVHATRGHMHLLGRSVKVELNPGTPQARTLLDVPAFDFDDQALHILPEPVTFAAGDTLRTTCTFDAGLRRQVPQLQDLPPRYVVWGEGTADEMCAALLTVS
jgi:putative flippase GtrA